MESLLIGYARCSTDSQDLAAQTQALKALGVDETRIYVDHGLTSAIGNVLGSGRPWPPAVAATRSS